jgi:hypothetical protein
VRYSEFEVEIDAAALKLEMDLTALELETDVAALKLEMDTAESTPSQVVCQEISKQEWYSAD